jgi:hypothetical protein
MEAAIIVEAFCLLLRPFWKKRHPHSSRGAALATPVVGAGGIRSGTR